jgi:16S rRNA (guanine966-N2)-methyltransferase
MDARRFVRQIEGKWDIVFLDPPYRHQMLPEILRLLVQYDRLADYALVYIEAERELGDVPLPHGWHRVKQKLAGQVTCSLVHAGKDESPQ